MPRFVTGLGEKPADAGSRRRGKAGKGARGIRRLSRANRASAAGGAVDVHVAQAVAAIAHPADLLAAGPDGRQPPEAGRAIERVEIDARSPWRAVMGALGDVEVVDRAGGKGVVRA